MKLEDKVIIKTLRANPDKGFRFFMQKYEKPLYWHIRRLVVSYDDARDVAQETFVRIFRKFEQFNDGSSLAAWIYKIATNESLRFLEKRKDDMDSLEQALSIKADEYVDYTDLEAIKFQKAIHTLPPKQQAAFNMRYYDDLSYEVIAHVIGSTASSAKMNYKLAKDKIITYIKEYE